MVSDHPSSLPSHTSSLPSRKRTRNHLDAADRVAQRTHHAKLVEHEEIVSCSENTSDSDENRDPNTRCPAPPSEQHNRLSSRSTKQGWIDPLAELQQRLQQSAHYYRDYVFGIKPPPGPQHLKQSEFVCGVCNKRYKRSNHFIRHQRSVHGIEIGQDGTLLL